MQISVSKKFDKSYQKRIAKNPVLAQRFGERLLLFEQEPFHPSLETHKLIGKLADLWAFSIAHDCRVIVDFVSDDEAVLVDVGSHDQVY